MCAGGLVVMLAWVEPRTPNESKGEKPGHDRREDPPDGTGYGLFRP